MVKNIFLTLKIYKTRQILLIPNCFKVSQKTYGTTCSTTSECLTSYNLTCSTYANQCQCPNSYPINTCDCLATQYYTGGIGCSNNYRIFFKAQVFL